ncbi:uncharacterized protein LOC144721038 [Lampetra planeri]
MSEMHWEARRRQSVADRKYAHAYHLQAAPHAQGSSPQRASPSYTETQAKLAIERMMWRLEEERRREMMERSQRAPAPPSRTATYSAKLPNRYNSVQYTQQW